MHLIKQPLTLVNIKSPRLINHISTSLTSINCNNLYAYLYTICLRQMKCTTGWYTTCINGASGSISMACLMVYKRKIKISNVIYLLYRSVYQWKKINIVYVSVIIIISQSRARVSLNVIYQCLSKIYYLNAVSKFL